MHILTKTAALVTLTVSLASCSGFVQDFRNLEAMSKSPKVTYADADQFRCDITKAPNTRGQVEDCGVCVNRSALPQVVTINGVVGQVAPGQHVIRCSDVARIVAMDPAPPTKR